MISPAPIVTPARAARIAGAMYLITMTTAVVADITVKTSLVVHGDAVKTAQNIAAAKGLYRLGIACDIITSAGVVVLIWALYVLLRPVSRELALLGAFLRMAEAALSFVMVLHGAYALRLLGDSAYLQAMDPAHLQLLAHSVLGAQTTVQNLMFVMLGLGSSVFTFLLFRSAYVPRTLAALGLLGSLLLATYAFTIFIQPASARFGVLPMLPLGLFEVTLGFWLLFGAGRIERRAASAASVSLP